MEIKFWVVLPNQVFKSLEEAVEWANKSGPLGVQIQEITVKVQVGYADW